MALVPKPPSSSSSVSSTSDDDDDLSPAAIPPRSETSATFSSPATLAPDSSSLAQLSSNSNSTSTTSTSTSTTIPPCSSPSLQQPPSQEFKRRRYRIPRSCDRCRASKIKCTFENGRCTACALAGVPCTFANPGSLKERPPTQKDVEHLQARIRSLERLIHALSPTMDLQNLPEPHRRLPLPLPDPSAYPPSETSADPLPSIPCASASLSPDRSLSSPGDHLSSSPIGGPRSSADLREPGPSSRPPVHEPNEFLDFNNVLGIPYSDGTDVNRSWSHLPMPQSAELSPMDKITRAQYQNHCFGVLENPYPEPDLEQHLMARYLEHVHPYLPILHLPSFLQLHASGAARTDASFRALCLFVFALGSRFSDDPRVSLDLEGQPHPSRQVAGLRFSFAASAHLYRPIATPATLYDLQAYVLLSIYSMGTVSPMTSWSLVAVGLQRAQEAGAHREHSRTWTVNPLRDYLRRQAFFVLHGLDNCLSAYLGRSAYLHTEDFDLTPCEVEPGPPGGSCVNPFLPSDPFSQDILNAAKKAMLSLSVHFGDCASLLPLLNLMHAEDARSHGPNLSASLVGMVERIDSELMKWYERVPEQLKLSTIHSSREHLISSVGINAMYHSLKIMVHRTMFDHADTQASSASTRRSNPDGSADSLAPNGPHVSACVDSAIQLIAEVEKLKTRKLLEYGCFWIPMKVTVASLILICSIKRQQGTVAPRLIHQKRVQIETSIGILGELAPSTFCAQASEKIVRRLYEMVDGVLGSPGRSSRGPKSGEKKKWLPGESGPRAPPASCSASCSASDSESIKTLDPVGNRYGEVTLNSQGGIDAGLVGGTSYSARDGSSVTTEMGFGPGDGQFGFPPVGARPIKFDPSPCAGVGMDPTGFDPTILFGPQTVSSPSMCGDLSGVFASSLGYYHAALGGGYGGISAGLRHTERGSVSSTTSTGCSVSPALLHGHSYIGAASAGGGGGPVGTGGEMCDPFNGENHVGSYSVGPQATPFPFGV